MTASLNQLAAEALPTLSRTEHRVVQYVLANRHQVLVQSAMELARAVGTSDATVIRAARALGFDGMEGMRRAIAEELKGGPVSPASRVSRTLLETGGDLRTAFETTLATQLDAIAALRQQVAIEDYIELVQAIADARETVVFGIGPSSAIASYLCTQLRRFGIPARALTETGLLLADQLLPMTSGDLVIIMAYGRVYTELEVLIAHATRLNLRTVLLTDSLGPQLHRSVSRVITISRGQSDAFSLHTATLAFLENLLVGLATARPRATVAALHDLDDLRSSLAGQRARLRANPAAKRSARGDKKDRGA